MKTRPIDLDLAKRVLKVLNKGLVAGLGVPEPGKMCVEAAVCYALGEPHGDRPTCVASAVRSFKIRLSDANWSSNKARTDGLRRIGIAQLGSVSIDENKFAKMLSELVIRRVLPMVLDWAASKQKIKAHQSTLELAAKECRKLGTRTSAINAKSAADAAAAYAYAAAAAAAAAAADAADAAAAAADAADAAYAADAADAAYADAAAAVRDGWLNECAECGIEALRQCKSPGVEFMDELCPLK